MTAASSNHAGPLRYLLESLRRLEARVECYDLGLTRDDVRALPRWDGLSYHAFNYAAYPPHLNVTTNAGEYAWKPVIVAEVVDRIRASGEPEDVLWSDAGSYFHALHPIAERIGASRGLWLRRSSGTMRQWTHPLMLEFLHADAARFAERPNADATLVGFATGHRSADVRDRLYRDVIAPWKACALTKDCIAPAGSSRRNHRQDQAALSYLVHHAGYEFADDTRAIGNIRGLPDGGVLRSRVTEAPFSDPPALPPPGTASRLQRAPRRTAESLLASERRLWKNLAGDRESERATPDRRHA